MSDLEQMIRAIVRHELARALAGDDDAPATADDDEIRRMAREHAAKLRRARKA